MSLSVEGEDEHPLSSLGHSEPLTVRASPCPHVPEFIHLTDETPKVSTGMAGEESVDILQEDGFGPMSLHKVKEGEGES